MYLLSERVSKLLDEQYEMSSSFGQMHWSYHGKHSTHLHQVNWILNSLSALCLVMRACLAPRAHYLLLVEKILRQKWFLCGGGWCGVVEIHSPHPDVIVEEVKEKPMPHVQGEIGAADCWITPDHHNNSQTTNYTLQSAYISTHRCLAVWLLRNLKKSKMNKSYKYAGGLLHTSHSF